MASTHHPNVPPTKNACEMPEGSGQHQSSHNKKVSWMPSGIPAEKLKVHLTQHQSSPVVFHEKITEWPASLWRPENVSSLFGPDLIVRLRIGPKAYAEGQVLWERDCMYEEVTMQQFTDWLIDVVSAQNPLHKYSRDKFWAYLDYKHMGEMFAEKSEILQAIDWSPFGFQGRDGSKSTLWIGSPSAHTPCHYDTYGCNLVAQIYGRKRWTLFPPADSWYMYPTRVPYEESSVFSAVPIQQPQKKSWPLHEKHGAPVVVTLEPGDVLFVPPKWWHFVECLETSISLNSWIELESDNRVRLEESVARMLVTGLMGQTRIPLDDWLNPTEELTDVETNEAYINQALKIYREGINKHNSSCIADSDSVVDEDIPKNCQCKFSGSGDVTELNTSSTDVLNKAGSGQIIKHLSCDIISTDTVQAKHEPQKLEFHSSMPCVELEVKKDCSEKTSRESLLANELESSKQISCDIVCDKTPHKRLCGDDISDLVQKRLCPDPLPSRDTHIGVLPEQLSPEFNGHSHVGSSDNFPASQSGCYDNSKIIDKPNQPSSDTTLINPRFSGEELASSSQPENKKYTLRNAQPSGEESQTKSPHGEETMVDNEVLSLVTMEDIVNACCDPQIIGLICDKLMQKVIDRPVYRKIEPDC